MKPSPLLMPTRKVAPAAPTALVYTTSTGDAPRRPRALAPARGRIGDDPFCFVCGRCTLHFAEHDDLVAAGLARYAPNGSVYRTDRWAADRAARLTTTPPTSWSL